MNWIVLLFTVVNVYTLCGGNKLDDFLQEKQSFLQQVDKVFDLLYTKNPFAPVIHSQPIPSPEWLDQTTRFEDGSEGHDVEELWIENDRPPEVGVIPRKGAMTTEKVFGGSGSGGGDQEDSLEELGSGDDAEVEHQVDLTTETVTSTTAPSETIDTQCASHLKAEVKSCVEMSLDVRTLVDEMGQLVTDTGYYNVSGHSEYVTQFLRVCMTNILTPPSCSRDDGDDGVIETATNLIVTFASRHDGHSFEVHDAKNFNCFRTHLFFLKTCLSVHLTGEQLDRLVKTVILRDNGEGLDLCQEFRDVRQCFVTSMSKCDDSTSEMLVKEMFDATARVVPYCALEHKAISDAMMATPLGMIIVFVLGILTVRLL